MPFTLSHPAAVVPIKWLLGRRVDLAAMVIGSMTPDVPYFVHLMPKNGHLGHSIPGLFTFCLPVGLAMYAAFHLVVRRPATALLPDAHRLRLARLTQTPIGPLHLRVLVAIISILIGAATHLGWDSLTHGRSHVVTAIPALAHEITLPDGTPAPIYAVLQWISTAVGVALLAFWYWRWFRRTMPVEAPQEIVALAPRARTTIAAGVVFLSIAGGLVVAGLAMREPMRTHSPLHVFAVRAAIGSVSTFCCAIIAVGLVMTLRRTGDHLSAQA